MPLFLYLHMYLDLIQIKQELSTSSVIQRTQENDNKLKSEHLILPTFLRTCAPKF